MEQKILVIGATGLLGAPVARCLKADGFQVRALTRDEAKARQAFDDSFEIVAADPLNVARLEEVLEGCQGVHINLPNEVEQQVAEQIAQIAAGKGVQRITYISGATVREENRWFPMADRKFRAEAAIRESGVAYTIFKPTWFMDALPLFVQNGRATIFGKQPHPYHWLAAADYARMVSAAYRTEAAAGKAFYIHGPDAMQMNDALTLYVAATHPEIQKVSNMPFWMAKSMAAMLRNPELKAVVGMMAYFEKVGEEGDPAEANRILGTPQITLKEWMTK